MRSKHWLLPSAALLFAVLGCAMQSEGYSAGASASVTSRGPAGYSTFYAELSQYGSWFDYGGYGRCWSPGDVSPGWRPYSVGHWVYSDAGWMWDSDEPWGWATYHYGRWVDDDDYGWVWVPGEVWAPSWVAWRYSDDWVGWAPLPPAATWSAGVGLTWSDDMSSRFHDDDWCFVPSRTLLDPSLRTRIVPAPRNRRLLVGTQVHVAFDVNGGRPRNLGLDEHRVQGWTNRPVPLVRVRDYDRPRPRRASAGAPEVPVYRPEMRPEPFAPPRGAEDFGRDDPRVEQERRAHHDEDRRRLDSWYQEQKRQIENDPQRGPGTASPGDRQSHHEDELRALDEQKARQSRIIDQRYEKRLDRGNRSKPKKGGKGDRGNDH